jgi:hypothetical protein
MSTAHISSTCLQHIPAAHVYSTYQQHMSTAHISSKWYHTLASQVSATDRSRKHAHHQMRPSRKRRRKRSMHSQQRPLPPSDHYCPGLLMDNLFRRIAGIGNWIFILNGVADRINKTCISQFQPPPANLHHIRIISSASQRRHQPTNHLEYSMKRFATTGPTNNRE